MSIGCLPFLERDFMAAERAPVHLPVDLAGNWHLDAEPAEEIPEVPPSETEPPVPPVTTPPTAQPVAEIPPSPEQLIEAMLFVGGHPLAPETACAAIRGLTPDRFHEAIDALTRQYRRPASRRRFRSRYPAHPPRTSREAFWRPAGSATGPARAGCTFRGGLSPAG
jgi:hypothetical protein